MARKDLRRDFPMIQQQWRCLFTAIVFTALPLFSTAADPIEELLSLTPAPPTAEADLLPRASQLGELLLIEIVDFRVFEVRRSPADYLLETSYTTSPSGDVWSVSLVSTRTEQTVFTTARSITDEEISGVISEVAQQLRQVAVELRLAQPADVYTLVELGQFSKAEQLLNRIESRDVSPETGEIAELRSRLNEERAVRAYEAAVELFESGYVSEASEFAARAVAWRPSNPTYRELEEQISEEIALMETAAVTRRAHAAATLISEGLFSAAESYLDLTEEEYPDSVDLIAEQREAASVGAQAREAFDAGMTAFWARNYERAYAHLQHAVDLDPDREEYREMLSSAESAIEELERTEVLRNEYRGRVASVQPDALWMTRRTPRSAWQVGLGRGRQRWSRTDSPTEESGEIRQWVVQGSLRYPRRLDLLDNFDSTALFWYWSAGGTFRVGGNENEYDSWADSDSDFYRLTVWSIAPFGGVGLLTNAASFGLQTGVQIDSQLLMLHELNRNTVRNEDSRDSTASLVPSVSLDFALHWYLNQEDSLILQIQHPVGSIAFGQPLENSERWRSGSVILGYSKGLQ